MADFNIRDVGVVLYFPLSEDVSDAQTVRLKADATLPDGTKAHANVVLTVGLIERVFASGVTYAAGKWAQYTKQLDDFPIAAAYDAQVISDWADGTQSFSSVNTITINVGPRL
jgi:hypothetical protein